MSMMPLPSPQPQLDQAKTELRRLILGVVFQVPMKLPKPIQLILIRITELELLLALHQTQKPLTPRLRKHLMRIL